MEKKVYDITEVCCLLDTTSRTLRFYEEKGIVESTKTPFSSRRHYTEAQVELIRNVVALRTLGLSIKAIIELQREGTDLKGALISKRAEIYASIETKNREIRILNEALACIDAGKDVFESSPAVSVNAYNETLDGVVRRCSEAVVTGDSELLYRYMSVRMKRFMPRQVYEEARLDTLQPLGNFVCFEKEAHDAKYPNVIYCYVKYQKLGLKIKYVFYNGEIDDFWFSYYES